MERILIILFLLFSVDVFASSCCGQSSSSYAVLFLKQKTSVNVGLSQTDVEGRVFSGDDFFVWPEDKKLSRSKISLDGAHEFFDRHQLFGSLSFVEGKYEEGSSFGESTSSASDLVLGYSYELLPEYTYSRLRPVVYVSSFLNLPTGTSIYEEKSLTEGAGVTGHSQYGFGVGLTLKKVFYPITVIAQAKVMRLLEETFGDTETSGFYDGTTSLLVTYSSPWWDLGLSTGLTYSFLSTRELRNFNLTSGSSNVNSVMFSVQKVLNESLSVSVAYSDQTLIGTPQNTLLNKAYSLNLTYNFFN